MQQKLLEIKNGLCSDSCHNELLRHATLGCSTDSIENQINACTHMSARIPDSTQYLRRVRHVVGVEGILPCEGAPNSTFTYDRRTAHSIDGVN